MDIKNLLEEINSLTEQVEKLAKSDMYKAEDEEKEEGAEMEGGEAAPAPEMEGGEAPEMEGGEPDQIEDQAEQLEDASEEGGESLDQVVKALDDEDLQELMAAVQAEMAQRQGGAEGAAPAPAAPAAPEMGKAVPPMHKAMDEMAKTMAEMKKSLDGLRAENVSLKKSAPVSRPAAMNRAEVQTMAKSDSVPEMLNKSEVVEYLLNTKAPVALVQDANWANSPSELREVYSKAELMGVKIPTKK